MRDAAWVFAGPGSPTFALRQWRDTSLPGVLRDKLRPAGSGGALVFSSAAALTLGCATVPVYEIYKCGMDPWWEEGLDLLAGESVSVRRSSPTTTTPKAATTTRGSAISANGASPCSNPNSPTERSSSGSTEHTGVIIDLDADTAEVVGKGGLTLRRAGRSVRVESGRTVPIDVLRRGEELGVATSVGTAVEEPMPFSEASSGPARSTPDGSTSLAARVAELEAEFAAAMTARDSDRAVEAVLQVLVAIDQWSNDTLQSDEMDQAHRALRSMIVKLGGAATNGLRDEREVLGPLVGVALHARRVAREAGAYDVSDTIRDGLAAAGIEVRDTPDGPEWHLTVTTGV